MSLLSSREFANWLIFVGAILVTLGLVGHAFTRNREAPGIPIRSYLHPAKQCRRCLHLLIYQEARTGNDGHVVKPIRPD